jgi:peptide/nickel transport system permease protein
VRAHPVAGVAGALLVGEFLAAVFAPWLAPCDPNAIQVVGPFKPVGTPGFLLGTDDVGRDLLSRLIFGARLSLGIGLGTVAAAAVIGVPLGLLAGYYRKADAVISRLVNLTLALPAILAALLIGAVVGRGVESIGIAVTLFAIPSFTRVARGTTLGTKELEYVEAARVLGVGDVRILLRYILPGAYGPLIVQATFNVAVAVLTTGTLSFLGVGIGPPTAEWGAMLGEGRAYLTYAPAASLVPGIAIFVTVMALNLLGDGLRDIFDPRTAGGMQLARA